ncbi:probable serine/threonine-protein kinase At1g54610 isoform X4 [Gossypium hirsutum]|uniref:Probable serine/threonine-protein kinase At1g54610 isoform X4 n=1 Tax=Gossypium hirsutum TaxID=3635 RepID=A0ABM2YMY4_GOSHI|nr:probable serine/threonine-protein kinase At1g54610 isoform X4 [Gossypium hirsutum]
MGCVLGREVSSGIVSESRESKNGSFESDRRVDNVTVPNTDANVVEVENAGTQEEEKADGKTKQRGERRKSKPNPRLSNLPKHLRGEQVAAGWPSWLSDACGEALNGWIPRRADTYEKIDKVKCYIHQLLSGLEHCHNRGVLHRDIKGSNLLIDDEGVLKIADFGLATFFDPNRKHLMTSRVVTLWYRAPELLLGATDYGVGVDLWSAGCILAELFAGRPVMPGRTEVEQLHKIYKLCGSPSDEYWKKYKLPNATLFKPREPYKRCIKETFKDFPPSSLFLIDTLLAIDPAERLTATAALRSEFFTTEPYACEPSSFPKYPPSKEIDAKRRDDEARRLRAAGKAQGDGTRKTRTRNRARAVPAPEANAELQSNLDRRRLISHANAKSKSEKFPPPHQDAAVGIPLGASHHIDPALVPPDIPFSFTSFPYPKEPFQTRSGPLVESSKTGAPSRKKHVAGGSSHERSKPPAGSQNDNSDNTRVKGKKSIL